MRDGIRLRPGDVDRTGAAGFLADRASGAESSAGVSAFDAWNTFARQQSDKSEGVLRHARTLFRDHPGFGEVDDTVKRAYAKLTSDDQERLSSRAQAELLYNQILRGSRYLLLGGAPDGPAIRIHMWTAVPKWATPIDFSGVFGATDVWPTTAPW